MRYEDLIGPTALDAVEALFENNRDLVLSFSSVEDVATQLAAFARLNSASLEKEESVYSAYQTALASLLHQGKVTLRSFGLSRAGKQQHDDLLRSIGALEPEVIEPNAQEKLLEQVKADYTHLPTDELQRRLKDPSYAAAYHAMVTEAAQ